MHPFLEIFALAGFFFAVGLIRGSVICATICAPAFATRAVDRGYSVRQGVAAALYFSIPRIIILTLLGAVIGYAAYSLSSSVEENVEPYERATEKAKAFGYFALGVIVVIIGLRMLIRNLDEMEDIKEGKQPQMVSATCVKCATSRGVCSHGNEMPDEGKATDKSSSENVEGKKAVGGIRGLMRDLDPVDRRLFFLSGGVLGMACTAELFAGTLFSGGGLAILQDSPLAAAVVAGGIMFAFSIGATIPVMAVMVAAVEAARKSTDAVRLNRYKIGGASMAVFMGILMILVSLATMKI